MGFILRVLLSWFGRIPGIYATHLRFVHSVSNVASRETAFRFTDEQLMNPG